jgi:multidrug efflux pump subunit AcrA (membrane-fusion protein)
MSTPSDQLPATTISSADLPDKARPGMRRKDLSFMPAVVETLESPPSPYATVLLGCLMVMCLIALVLMIVGRVDIVASGRGVIIPPGNVVHVQAEIQGRIVALPATDGSNVKVGDLLIELEHQSVDAQIQTVEINLAAARFRRAMQVAILDWLDRWSDIDPEQIELPKADLVISEEQKQFLRQKARLIRAQLANELIPQRRLVLLADERRQASQSLDETSEKIAGLEQDLIKAQSQRRSCFIRASASGTLVALVPLANGMVVSPAQPIMQIVPTGSSLMIEAKIPTPDLGHVRLGHPCIVKLDAFPYTSWGKITCTVDYLGANAIEEKDGKAFFIVRGELNQLPEPLLRAGVKLSSGMSGSVEITTGQRSVLAYLLSPVVESVGRSLHER